jgi:anti-sigma factor (TIGR02949 family)
MNVVDFDGGQCKRVLSYLDSYLSDELLVETNHEVLKHLESCENCARALDERARVRAQLKRVVLSQPAPESLRDRIKTDIRRERRASSILSARWLMAAAAVVVLAVGLGIFLRSRNDPSARLLSPIAEVVPANNAAQILKVGFDGHVCCAIDHGMANRRFTVEQMSEKLGPQYEGLVALVKATMPQDYDVVIGHRCHYQSREFIHLILRRNDEVVSLIVTRKGGQSFSAAGAVAVMEAAGVPIYESPFNNLQVAGMETRDYLAFVISNDSQSGNERLASSLMPAVGDFLKRTEA